MRKTVDLNAFRLFRRRSSVNVAHAQPGRLLAHAKMFAGGEGVVRRRPAGPQHLLHPTGHALHLFALKTKEQSGAQTKQPAVPPAGPDTGGHVHAANHQQQFDVTETHPAPYAYRFHTAALSVLDCGLYLVRDGEQALPEVHYQRFVYGFLAQRKPISLFA